MPFVAPGIALCFSTLAIATSAISRTSGTQHRLSLTSDGHLRQALLHLPPTASASRETTLALVTVLHSAGHMASHPSETAGNRTGMTDLADREGFAVLYPEGLATTGIARAGRWQGNVELGIGRTWNAGSCCPDATAFRENDVDFVKSVVELTVRRVSAISEGFFVIDSSRVYLTGGSNGAMMTNRLACEAPGWFAAIAAVSGMIVDGSSAVWPSDPYDCATQQVPTLAFHGTKDPLVPWAGNPLLGFPSIESYISRKKALNHVVGSHGTVTLEQDGVQCVAYGDKASNFTFCRHDSGHCWPGVPGACTTAIDASALMWQFFKQYRLEANLGVV